MTHQIQFQYSMAAIVAITCIALGCTPTAGPRPSATGLNEVYLNSIYNHLDRDTHFRDGMVIWHRGGEKVNIGSYVLHPDDRMTITLTGNTIGDCNIECRIEPDGIRPISPTMDDLGLRDTYLFPKK